ncbi:hypothetical protein BJV74DRAFT_854774 [Russula compacta]|nr:hypothetical protein BJV74DRAFT_854774 [Russula compacta]
MSKPEPALIGDSFRNVWATASNDAPLPPPNEVLYTMPIQTAPSNLRAEGKGSIFSPRELIDYDTEESRPLLQQPSTTSLKSPPNYEQTEPAQSVAIFASQNEGPSWPVPMRQFASLGWQEFLLPDGTRYFSNSTLHTVTDVDLRNAERLEAITTFLDGRDTEVLSPPGWELWLRDASEPTTTRVFVLLKAWVHHGARMVSFERPSSNPGEIMNKYADKRDMEYQYWSFMMSHPAHTLLPPDTVPEAIDVLTWSYTDRLLPSPHPSLPPFSQEECQELLTLLRSFSNVSAQTVSVVRTRVVSKVLVRVAAWRQGRDRDGANYSGLQRNDNGPPTRVLFLRTAGDFLISFLCLVLPYRFLERPHYQRFDREGGIRSTAGPMLVVGAEFITLPGIDDVSRIPGFLAILLSASSFISAVIALFRYKSDIENPIASPRGEEGPVLLSVSGSIFLSLPLIVFLYGIAAFIGDLTQWAGIGTVGGLARILLTSQMLIH